MTDKLVEETVNMVNGLTSEEGKRIEAETWMRLYGSTDASVRGYQSFWD
jgi:hypothetical protein